jgi:hypothetical protein
MKCAGISGEESGNAIAIDSSGFLYVTGGYDFTIDFGSGGIPNSGLIDVFIVKLNAEGIAQWSDHAGAAGTDMGTSVALDRNGNIYLSGIFSDTSLFGSFQQESRGLTDIFVAKIGAQLDVHNSLSQTNGAISFYPNPAKDQLNVKLISYVEEDIVRVELFSLLGQSLKKIIFPNSGSVISLPVSDLAGGGYLCHIAGNGWSESRLVVIGR